MSNRDDVSGWWLVAAGMAPGLFLIGLSLAL